MAIAFPFVPVESQIAAYRKAECLYRVDILPTVAAIPNFYQGVLNDIFRLFVIQSDTKSQSIEHVFNGNTSFRKLILFICSI